MKSFNQNSKKSHFLDRLPKDDIESSNIEQRSKFNFSYFIDDQDSAQSLQEWEQLGGACALSTLLDKIKEYTRQPLSFWRNERVGSGGLKVFDIYGDFPQQSKFQHPKHVPHDVHWARFRLASKVRLIGFVLPAHLDQQEQNGHRFCKNTFYVVFLDKEHQFYLSSSEKD